MSDCSGPDCTHDSHNHGTPRKVVKPSDVQENPRAVVAVEETPQIANPIITPTDQERWPLLEVASQPCSIPVNDTDAAVIGKMDAVLDMLGDTAAGLAAVQVGYPKRIFLLRENGVNRVFINPVIISQSREQKKDGEACLSLPGFNAVFKRPKSVTLQYHELDSEVKLEVFEGFWARAVMHEMNHLDGILITRHMEDVANRQPKRTKFKMVLDTAAKNRIAKRRAKKKFAKKQK